jgi:hypothetical protein
MGVREDLMTSPPEQNPVNGGRRGPSGVYGTADSITTNREGRRFESCRARYKSPANAQKQMVLVELPGVIGSSRYKNSSLSTV